MTPAIDHCIICQEDDLMVLLQCRDGITRCAHHAIQAGYCADCGDGEPRWYGDEMTDGLCYDCRSAYERLWQKKVYTP